MPESDFLPDIASTCACEGLLSAWLPRCQCARVKSLGQEHNSAQDDIRINTDIGTR